MKSKKLILVVVALLLRFPVVFSDDSPFSVEYQFNPVLENDQWVIENTTLREIPGEPLVPYYSARILLPQDTVVKDIRVRTDTPVVQRGFDLPWGQPPCTFSDESNSMPRKVSKNEAIYNSDELYPGEIYEVVSVGYCRGFPILNVLLYPMQYQPKSRVVKLYSNFTVEVDVEKGMKNEMYRGLPEDKGAVVDMVDNPDMVTTYSGEKSLVASKSLEPGTYEYIIITNSILEPKFQKLVEWKAKFVKGAKVVEVEWIYDNYPGYDNPESIRNFIKDAYDKWDTRYFLLGGDVSVVPYRRFSLEVIATNHERIDDNIAGDIYFACLDGNFNADGDHIYGETNDDVDFEADVAVGRAPVETNAEAQNFVDKIIAYEQADKPKVCQFHASYINPGNVPDSRETSWVCEQYLPPDYIKKELFETNGRVTKRLWRSAWSGTYGGPPYCPPLIFQHKGHGYPQYYYINHEVGGNYWTGGIKWENSDCSSLTNNNFWPVHTTSACFVGRFHLHDCLAENLINDDAGAIACITNSSYGLSSSHSAHGVSGKFIETQFIALFVDKKEKLGDLLNQSKSYWIPSAPGHPDYRWCFYEINLLGDPETPILTKRPYIYITHPQLQQTISDTVTITTDTYGVDTVKFFINYKLVHTDETFPFTYTWDTTKYDDGTHHILVIGESNMFEGNHIVFVRVDNSFRITNPQNNEIVNEIVTIKTTASGIDTVKFYIDGILEYTDTSAPFTYDWDTTACLRGYHTIEVKGYKDGIPKSSHQIEVYVDNTIFHTLSITYPKNGQEVSGIVTIKTTASGIDTAKFYIDGNLECTDTSEPYDYEWDTTEYPNGEHIIMVEGFKNGVLEKTSQITVNVQNGTSSDMTPPDTTIISGPTGIINYNTVTFDWTGSDNATSTQNLTYSYYLAGYEAQWSQYTSTTSRTYYNLPNGTYAFCVRAKDQAGNIDPSETIREFTVNYGSSDTTPPITTITSGPTQYETINYNTVTFEWTGSDDMTATSNLIYTYTLSGYDSGWSSYTSETSKTYYNLSDRVYIFKVRAIDEAGNFSEGDARTFTVNCAPQDTTPPDTTITAGPTGTITYNTVTFEWTSSDDVSAVTDLVYSYLLQGYDTGWSECASDTSIIYENLPNGYYTFYVKSKDEAGNESMPVYREFTVDCTLPDTTPPDTLITAGPSGTITTNSAIFEWIGEDDVTSASGLVYSYYLEGYDAVWSQFTSDTSIIYENLPNDYYTFYVKAKDEAGNISTPVSRTFTVNYSPQDTIPPTATITSGPTGTVTSNTVTFEWTGSDNVTATSNLVYSIYLDGYDSGWSEFISETNKTYYDLLDGSYTFYLRAKDEAGNISTPITRSFTVSCPSSLKITNPQDGQAVSGIVTITTDFTDIDAVSFYIDNNYVYTDTTAPFTCEWDTIKHTNGEHTVKIEGYKENTFADSDEITVLVDNSGSSSITITNPQDGQTVSEIITITTDTTNIDKVYFYINNTYLLYTDRIAPFYYEWDTTRYLNGVHTIKVVGYKNDSVKVSDEITVIVKNIEPSLSITYPKNEDIVSGTITITTEVSGIFTAVYFYIDSTWLYTDMAAPFTREWDTTKYTNGEHTVRVMGYKENGLADSDKITITVDNSGPSSISITNPQDGQEVSNTVAITTDTTNIDMVRFYIDSTDLLYADTNAPFYYEWDTTRYLNGVHTIKVEGYKNDSVKVSDEITVIVKNIEPSLSITYPKNEDIVSGTITITTEVSGVYIAVHIYIDSTWLYTDTHAPFMWNWDTTEYADTEHTIRVVGCKESGFTDSDEITVMVDNSGPSSMSITNPQDGQEVSGIVTITIDATAIDLIFLFIDNIRLYSDISAPFTYKWDTTEYPNGEHTIRVEGYKGSIVKTDQVTVNIQNSTPQDATPPIATITSGPTGIINYNTTTFEWTGSDDMTPTQDLVYSFKLEGYDTEWSPYTSETSKTYHDLSNRAYIFNVRAIDEAGNVSEPATRSFEVNYSPPDTTPPDTTITSGPTGIINYNTITFEWTGSDDMTPTQDLVYSYYLAGYDAQWSQYSSNTSATYYDLPNGTFTLYVRAKDQAGNIDPSEAARIFEVNYSPPDTTPPTVTITSGPTGTVTTNTVTFEWTGSDDMTPTQDLVYTYLLEGYDTEWCELTSSTSRTYYNLLNNTYTFYVRAKDAAGNESIPVTRTFMVNYTSSTIQFNTYSVDDDNRGNSYGNTDGVINPGEFINLLIYLENTGNETVNNITATVSTESPYVNPYNAYFFDSDLYFGNIPGEAIVPGDDLDFMVSSDAPDGTVITFDLTITDLNNTTWYDSFDVTVTGSDTLPPRTITMQTSSQIFDVGDTVDISVFVEEGSDMSSGSVIAQIEDINKTVLASINLYDDGMHNDGNAGDRVFGGSWTITQAETDFMISISTVDNAGNSAEWVGLAGFTTKTFIVSYKILLVDDDNRNLNALVEAGPYQSYYTDALDANGLLYDAWEYFFRGSPDSSILIQYDMVIWLTGDTSGEWYFPQGFYTETLSSTDQTNLMIYLNNGGSLLISGQLIDDDIVSGDTNDQVFYNTYLHAESVLNWPNLCGLSGVTGNPVTDGLHLTITGGDGANNQYSAAEINPTNGAKTILTYDPNAPSLQSELNQDVLKIELEMEWETSQSGTLEKQQPKGIVSSGSAAISVDTGTYKVVYFAFGFEAIDNPADRSVIMRKAVQWLHGETQGALPHLFDTDSYMVVGDPAYCTDVLGTAKISYGLALGGASQNPEGRTDFILTTAEHDTGNLITVGGPAVNPVADEFGNHFGITYTYQENVSFEIFCESQSIYLDVTKYPSEDICIVYLGEHNNRNVLLVWGYGWQGTYVGSVFIGDPANWQAYQGANMLMLRWVDSNGDGLVQSSEIIVESHKKSTTVKTVIKGITNWVRKATDWVLSLLFNTNSYFVVGDEAYCTDVLGTAKISYGLALGGASQNPEGRTDFILTTAEHDTGNLITVGGPAVNPVADEFGNHFGITYTYQENVSFEIFCESQSIYLDVTKYPSEDICIVYLGEHNNRNVLLVWGYGWYSTYAGSVFAGNPENWQTYSGAHMFLLRWRDFNGDGLVQPVEVIVEAHT